MVYLYVGLGGALGSILRYGFSLIPFPFWNQFPVGTLLVNLIGSFLIGWLTFMLPQRRIPKELKNALTSGLIGSFTTFSALSVEAVQMLQNSSYLLFLIYILVSIFGGLLLVRIGILWGMKAVKNT